MANHLAVRRSQLPLAALCVLLCLPLLVAACGKTPAKQPPAAPAAQAAALPAAVTPSQAMDAPARRARLASAYHAIRCVLVGERFAPDHLYSSHGFATAQAFSQAFQKAASADPVWAQKAIADSYAAPCKGNP